MFVVNNEMVLWQFFLAEAVVGGTFQEGAAWKLGSHRKGKKGPQADDLIPTPFALAGHLWLLTHPLWAFAYHISRQPSKL